MDKKKKVKTEKKVKIQSNDFIRTSNEVEKKTDKLQDLSEDEIINLYHVRCLMNFIMKVREGKYDKYFEEDKKE